MPSGWETVGTKKPPNEKQMKRIVPDKPLKPDRTLYDVFGPSKKEREEAKLKKKEKARRLRKEAMWVKQDRVATEADFSLDFTGGGAAAASKQKKLGKAQKARAAAKGGGGGEGGGEGRPTVAALGAAFDHGALMAELQVCNDHSNDSVAVSKIADYMEGVFCAAEFDWGAVLNGAEGLDGAGRASPLRHLPQQSHDALDAFLFNFDEETLSGFCGFLIKEVLRSLDGSAGHSGVGLRMLLQIMAGADASAVSSALRSLRDTLEANGGQNALALPTARWMVALAVDAMDEGSVAELFRCWWEELLPVAVAPKADREAVSIVMMAGKGALANPALLAAQLAAGAQECDGIGDAIDAVPSPEALKALYQQVGDVGSRLSTKQLQALGALGAATAQALVAADKQAELANAVVPVLSKEHFTVLYPLAASRVGAASAAVCVVLQGCLGRQSGGGGVFATRASDCHVAWINRHGGAMVGCSSALAKACAARWSEGSMDAAQLGVTLEKLLAFNQTAKPGKKASYQQLSECSKSLGALQSMLSPMRRFISRLVSALLQFVKWVLVLSTLLVLLDRHGFLSERGCLESGGGKPLCTQLLAQPAKVAKALRGQPQLELLFATLDGWLIVLLAKCAVLFKDVWLSAEPMVAKVTTMVGKVLDAFPGVEPAK